MDLRQLAVLRAIADTGSFGIAAQRVGLTQPAVSHQLRRLEDELGETLVLRRRPRAVLSPAGATVLAAAERILAEVDQLKHAFAPGDAAPLSGVLRVTASPLGIVYLYGELIARFIAEHPGIELVLTATETPHDGVRRVIAREADAAFVAFPIPEPGLAELALGQTEHVVLVSKDHPLAAQRAVSAAQLKAHPMVRYKTGAGSRYMSDTLFLPRGGYPDIFLESNDTEFVKRIVGLGFATAIVPRFVVTDAKRDRHLRRVRLRGPSLRQKYGLVFRPDARMRALAAFADFCADHKAMVPK
ncbi:MAG: LysR family transcriptional regulator [Rhodospirillaceae bacterium]|nr:LysR family transcriptional regulator [Rhodospirillaceae bacterium]